MSFLGIDLHSNCFTCCFLYENGQKVHMEFNLKPEELESFYSFLNLETYVMVESSTNTFKFVELIKEKVKEVIVANTHKLKLISMSKKKTDKSDLIKSADAEKLAIYLKMQIVSDEELIKPVYIPENKVQDLRSLFTTYKVLRKEIGIIKNRIHSILKQNLFPFTKEYIFGRNSIKKIKALKLNEASKFQIDLLFDQLENIEGNVKKVESKILIMGLIFEKEIDILTSMKGISVFTAIALMSDIDRIERFPNSKHFASYLRSIPTVEKSNEEVKIKSTNKCGRKLSITLLSQSLNHFRDSDLRLNKWYKKKVNIEKHKKGKIRMGLCRKVFAQIYQMLKKKEYHYHMDEKNHERKMEEYKKFLINCGLLQKRA